jgi:hypothetical protein
VVKGVKPDERCGFGWYGYYGMATPAAKERWVLFPTTPKTGRSASD